MAKEKFEERKLTGSFKVACKFDDGTVRYWEDKKEVVVSHIVQILREYQQEGYVLTLRQLHYQLVTQNWIVNHDTAYKKLGNILDDCRYAGVIDWNLIEDRGRKPYIPYSVKDVPDALQDTVDQYRLNRQNGQKNHVELWTEKDALSGILRRSTEKYHIQLVVNKGYTSSSALYGAYQRYIRHIKNGVKVTILYFGDHDPSGLDMIRDIKERLLIFLCNGDSLGDYDFLTDVIIPWWNNGCFDVYDLINGEFCSERVANVFYVEDEEISREFEQGRIRLYLEQNDLFEVLPIGLTMKQIKQYKLPPNPTKLTDSRADKYISKYGKTCWEVDALRPQTLTDIVEKNIEEQINLDLFESMVVQEDKDIAKLTKMIEKLNK